MKTARLIFCAVLLLTLDGCTSKDQRLRSLFDFLNMPEKPPMEAGEFENAK